jgi:hypothetical protein
LVRNQKFAENINESEPGITAVGIALHHHSGASVAALSISIPTVRYRRDHVADLVTRLRQVAARIEIQLLSGDDPSPFPAIRSGRFLTEGDREIAPGLQVQPS